MKLMLNLCTSVRGMHIRSFYRAMKIDCQKRESEARRDAGILNDNNRVNCRLLVAVQCS